MSETAFQNGLAGVNQRGLRDHNERLLLAMIRQLQPIPASELARRVNLSAQTVSVIVRTLERDGILRRGDPVRGKVGKPSVPMMLDPDGAFSLGLKIGRRTAELAIMDLAGKIRGQEILTYRYPEPKAVFGFLAAALDRLLRLVPSARQHRVLGLGVAMPFEIWKWAEASGKTSDFRSWEHVDLAGEIAHITDLPVSFMNDGTAACRAEHNFGAGARYRDFAYFFVGSFIGGGVALNGAVIDGNRGNAGALGSLQSVDDERRPVQLIDRASLHLLETRIAADGHDPAELWARDADWARFEPSTDAWIAQSAGEIARASLSACAVLDFEAVIVDGAFPEDVRARLAEAIKGAISTLDARGILLPEVVEGHVGPNARVVGAAFAPIARELLP